MEAGLCVVILPREPQVVGDPLNANLGIAEGIIPRRPNDKTAGCDQLLRGAQMIVLVPVAGAAYSDKERIGPPLGSRCPAVGPQLISSSIVLTDQTFIRVYKIGPVPVNVFPQTFSERIIVILGNDRT
jgi:hypothetical protein